MDTVNLTATLTLVVLVLISVKLFYDQNKFLRAYRKRVNPPFPILPGETPKMFNEKLNVRDISGLNGMSRLTKIMLARPQDEVLLRLWKRVWGDFFIGIIVMLGGFALVAFLILGLGL